MKCITNIIIFCQQNLKKYDQVILNCDKLLKIDFFDINSLSKKGICYYIIGKNIDNANMLLNKAINMCQNEQQRKVLQSLLKMFNY